MNMEKRSIKNDLAKENEEKQIKEIGLKAKDAFYRGDGVKKNSKIFHLLAYNLLRKTKIRKPTQTNISQCTRAF